MPAAAAPLSAESVRRLGTASLVANIVVIFGLGFCSIPGAFFAARARRLALGSASELADARRALRISALLLSANLLVYLLLAVVAGVVALSILAAAR